MLAFGFALMATPLLFGLARLVTTGSDWRYLAVAIASTLGASVAFRSRSQGGMQLLIAAASAFLLAAVTAVVLGGRSVVSVGLVAAGFAFCSVAGASLVLRARAKSGAALGSR